jgi:hypothetical protein
MSGIAGIAATAPNVSNIFSTLSIGGQRPATPVNALSRHAPSGNLTQAASDTFQAILKINAGSGPPLVSFSVTSQPPVPILSSAPSLPPSSKPQYVLPSSSSLVARLTATVRQIAINAAYPAPIFSFHA